jgi:hypothetical protein
MPRTADKDSRVVIVSASEMDGKCPLCGCPVSDQWPIAVDTEMYNTDATHYCPTADCQGAASLNY